MVTLDIALPGSHSLSLYSLVLSLQIWQLDTSRNFKIDNCSTFIITYRHVQSKENSLLRFQHGQTKGYWPSCFSFQYRAQMKADQDQQTRNAEAPERNADWREGRKSH